jgi:hypothetical protein
VGQDSYNPRFDTPGVQPGYRRQGEEGGWGRGSVPGSNRLQLSDRDRQEAAARVAALKEQLNEVGDQGMRGGRVCTGVVGGGGEKQIPGGGRGELQVVRQTTAPLQSKTAFAWCHLSMPSTV